MVIKTIKKPYCKFAVAMPIPMFIKNFLKRYCDEKKFSIGDAGIIEYILTGEFSDIIYCKSEIFEEFHVYLRSNTGTDYSFISVLEAITESNSFIGTLDLLENTFDIDISNYHIFRKECLRFEHLFARLGDCILSDIEEMIESGEIEYV